MYAGEAATGSHISIWLALAALSLALFLAIGKRRAELTLIQSYQGVLPKDTRASLSHYSEKLLDAYTSMFATSTFISYTYYTFLARPINEGLFFKNYNDFIIDFPERKWMMVTIPFVLYGIMRYMQLIYHGKGESPEQVLTTDFPLLSTVLFVGHCHYGGHLWYWRLITLSSLRTDRISIRLLWLHKKFHTNRTFHSPRDISLRVLHAQLP